MTAFHNFPAVLRLVARHRGAMAANDPTTDIEAVVAKWPLQGSSQDRSYQGPPDRKLTMPVIIFAIALTMTPAEAELGYRRCLKSWSSETELLEAPSTVWLGRAVEACANERAKFVDSLASSRPEDDENANLVRRHQAEWRVGEFDAQLLRKWVRTRFELNVHDQLLPPLE